jgi:GNAT superfamily N-acetyltransferase
MNKINIKFDLSEACKETLNENLRRYNDGKNEYLKTHRKTDIKYFGFYAYESEKIVGGAYGWIDQENWVYLDLLYVDEEFRGQDIGTMLINAVERFAKENKCVGILTETWSFQAKGFYEKMNFAVYGLLEDHPIGAIDYKLKKLVN